MCSQPIEHDAQLLRATPRSSCSSSAANRGRSSKVRGGEVRVGSVLDRVERQAGSPASQLAVLRGGRAEAALAQVRGGGQHPGRSATSTAVAAFTSTALMFFAPKHRAEARRARHAGRRG
jgi:hypothetical protein